MLAALLAAGCSTVGRLGYENLPTLATWRADHYLSLDASQRELAGRRLEQLQAWHRRTQLDDYVSLLHEVQRQASAGEVDEARVRGWRLAAFERWKPVAEQAAPAIAELAATLTPAQIERFREELERDNDKLRRKWLPADRGDRIEARAKRYMDRAETFLGSLTSEQKQFARRFAAQAPDSEEQWFAQRVERQKELLATLDRIRAERPDATTGTRWMREHLMRYGQARDASGRATVESSMSAGDAMTAAMFAQATPKQRQHLQRTLRDWIELLEGLRGPRAAGIDLPGTRAMAG